MVTDREEIQSSDDPEKSRLRLWIQLLRAARSIEVEVRDRLRLEFDETLPRFDVMAALARKPDGMMMSELSRHLMVSNGNVTGIVDRLVKSGLAVRSQRDGDRRSWIICLSRPGKEHFEKMAHTHESWIGELLQNIAPNEAEALIADLLRLSKHRLEKHEKNS
jgi:DNA-binding MarR family transcriptional regulator